MKPPRPTGSEPTVTIEPFNTSDPIAAYHYFRPQLEAAPPLTVLISRGDPAVMRVNVGRGVASFSAHRELIRRRAPLTPVIDLLELPTLALAFLYASDRVAKVERSDYKALLVEIRPLRELLLSQLEILAQLGFVSVSQVAEIRGGTGALDTARDGVAIAGMYRDHAVALAGRHPFTAEQIARVGSLGSALLHLITPAGAIPEPTQRNPDAIVRDLFYTELVRRHAALREAGVAAVGLRRLDELFPPLGARVVTTAASAETAPA